MEYQAISKTTQTPCEPLFTVLAIYPSGQEDGLQEVACMRFCVSLFVDDFIMIPPTKDNPDIVLWVGGEKNQYHGITFH